MSFKTNEWTRKVRDENYEKCKEMSTQEKIEYTKREADERLSEKKMKKDKTSDQVK